MHPPEANTWRVRMKANAMLLRFYVRGIARRSHVVLPLLLLGFSAVLVVVIALPKLGERLFPPDPMVLQISGVISEDTQGAQGGVQRVAFSGAVVEVGGFRTTSGAGGRYELRFRSETREDIPVLCRWGSRWRVQRLTVPADASSARMDFVLQ